MPRAAVVGKGLFGLGAARHLVKAGFDVTIIGPDEPVPGTTFAGPHGAHFDEARILVARGDRDEVELTNRTVSGLLQLEADSGEPIVTQSGSVQVLRRGRGHRLIDGAFEVGVDAELLEVPPPQGYYNPRSYLKAGLAEIAAGGATILTEVVTEVEPKRDGYSVSTADRTLEASAVVIASGAWSNGILARHVALRRKREHVLFAKVDAAAAAAMVMRPAVFGGATGAVEDVYLLPPLRYPDGSWYLKLGANTLHDQAVLQGSIDEWYADGDSSVAEPDLVAAFCTILPQIEVEAFHTERCVITYTAHGKPYLDQVADGLYVAIGGNGHGASWADGAGQLVARLVTEDGWPGFSSDAFRAIFEDERPRWRRPLTLSERAG